MTAFNVSSGAGRERRAPERRLPDRGVWLARGLLAVDRAFGVLAGRVAAGAVGIGHGAGRRTRAGSAGTGGATFAVGNCRGDRRESAGFRQLLDLGRLAAAAGRGQIWVRCGASGHDAPLRQRRPSCQRRADRRHHSQSRRGASTGDRLRGWWPWHGCSCRWRRARPGCSRRWRSTPSARWPATVRPAISSCVSAEAAARAVGAVRLSSDVGLVAGPATAGFLADAAGVEAPFVVLGAVALAAMGGMLIVGRRPRTRDGRVG